MEVRISGLLKQAVLCLLLLGSVSCNRAREVVTEAYPDGAKKVVQYFKKDQTLPFKEIQYYQDGVKMMEGTFVDGKRNGKWYYWYPDGQLWTEGTYEMEIEQGYKVVFHENGKKYYEGNFIDGNRSGIWKFYDTNGILLKEIDYDAELSSGDE
jgi:antitoxin component YwqK of YwqJK toxin-antitoxin module